MLWKWEQQIFKIEKSKRNTNKYNNIGNLTPTQKAHRIKIVRRQWKLMLIMYIYNNVCMCVCIRLSVGISCEQITLHSNERKVNEFHSIFEFLLMLSFVIRWKRKKKPRGCESKYLLSNPTDIYYRKELAKHIVCTCPSLISLISNRSLLLSRENVYTRCSALISKI